MVDAVLFEQALFNLLDNAAKYAPAADGAHRVLARRDAVRLQVLDEGEGIPPDDLERIFDKFYRVQKGDQVRAGTGLGLAIARGFVEAVRRHDRGGEPHRPQGRGVHHQPAGAEVGDARGEGAHERGAEPDPRRRRRAAHPQAAAHGARLAGLRGDRGAERQGGAGAARQKPALVILDLGLPDVDGLELLRRIRQAQEDVPIVVLSSRGDEAGKVAALDLGADDYVTKPFGMEELLARMRAALRHQLQVHGERPVFQRRRA